MIGLRKIKNTIIFIVTVAILTMFCSCCKRSEIKLGSGNEGGIYYKFADTLGDIDENITNIRTAGSQANMRLLKDGFINMGIVQSDVLSEAVNGTGDFNGNKINNVRAVSALYMESFQIIVPADSDIQTPADLKGKKVGVGLGTNYEEWLRQNVQGVDVRTYDDDPTKYQDLRVGRIDAILVDRLAALDLVKKTNDTLAVTGEAFSRQESGVALRKGNEDLLKAVNDAIAEMQKDGTLQALSEKWFGADVTK